MSFALCKAIDQSFKDFSQNTALIQHQANGDSVRLTFQELHTLAGKVYGLFGADLGSGDTVGLYMQRSVEHVASVVACLYATSAYTTINNLVSAKQVCHIAKDSNLKLLICDNSTLLKLRALTQDKVNQKILSTIRIVHLRQTEKSPPVHQQTIELLANFTHVESVLLPEAQALDLIVPAVELFNKAKLILFTSGSTGNPKGVMIQGDDLVKRAVTESKAYGLQEADVLLNMLPFSFDVGCNQLYSSLMNGCSLVLLNSWMPKDIVSAIVQYQVKGVSGVPSLWLSVINSDAEAVAPLSDILRYITISGGDMGEKDRLKLRDILSGVKIFKTYGQTETFRSTMLLDEDFDEKHQSVGRPIDGVTLYVLDEDGNKLGAGQKGQVIHQGIGTMLGYIGDAGATKNKLKKMSDADDDVNVIYTGDLGAIDTDGFLYLHGRQDRMIKVRGNRVYPEEIEKELCAHDDVIEAVSSYNVLDEAIAVYARKKQGAELTEKDVIKFLSSRLPSYMIPSQCLLYDDFPRTSSGKVDMLALTVQVDKSP